MQRIHQNNLLKFLTVVLLMCQVALCPSAFAENDPTLLLKEVEIDSGVEIDVLPPHLIEATVTVKGEFKNMKGTGAIPYTTDISAVRQNFRKVFPVFKAVAKDPSCEYTWDWTYWWQVGNRGGRHNDNILYELPYQPNEQHAINQTYGGSFSHQRGTDEEFAVDFDMPEGNVVCAARAGMVVAVRAESTRSGTTRNFEDLANYVVIKHDDGTYGRYVHLRTNGSLVRLGQIVQPRQPIALSGVTGWAESPHLHFEVYVPINGERRRTLPVRFSTRMGAVPILMEGMVY